MEMQGVRCDFFKNSDFGQRITHFRLNSARSGGDYGWCVEFVSLGVINAINSIEKHSFLLKVVIAKSTEATLSK